MKCPSCGAEIGSDKFCQYCGSQVTMEMKKEQEYVNKAGCPKCGSSNISFSREKQGEMLGDNGSAVVHATVGICHDCGYTWSTAGHVFNTNAESQSDNATRIQQPEKKRRTWLWVLGWIFIFPLPLMLILLKKDMRPAIKYVIIAVAWIVYLIVGFAGGITEDTEKIDTPSSKTAIIYEDDESINAYINNYNTANPDDIITSKDIQKDVHHGQVHDNQINILKENDFEINVGDSASMQVFIKGDQGSTDDYKTLMFKYAKGINPSLTNETLENYWKQTLDDDTHFMEFEEIELTIYMFNNNIEYLTITGDLKK